MRLNAGRNLGLRELDLIILLRFPILPVDRSVSHICFIACLILELVFLIMVDPISVVAAVDTCYSIAKELHTYMEKVIRFQAKVGRLSIRFEDDNTVLSRFVAFFRKEEDQIHEDDKKWLKRLFPAA
jgi:hypothetical protein